MTTEVGRPYDVAVTCAGAAASCIVGVHGWRATGRHFPLLIARHHGQDNVGRGLTKEGSSSFTPEKKPLRLDFIPAVRACVLLLKPLLDAMITKNVFTLGEPEGGLVDSLCIWSAKFVVADAACCSSFRAICQHQEQASNGHSSQARRVEGHQELTLIFLREGGHVDALERGKNRL